MKAQRYRIQFSKTEAMRYTGHLDLILTWERTFRRAGLPLSYSEGFNPRPVINLASPLPLGFTGTAELGDFWLSESVEMTEFENALHAALPPGLSINQIIEIEEVFGSKLPALVTSSGYSVDIEPADNDLETKLSNLLSQQSIMRTKRGKQYDLRPLILDLNLAKSSLSSQTLNITLVTLPDKTGRPDEVLATLGIPTENTRITRISIELRAEDKD